MEEMINSFNVEIGVFLYQMRLFANRNNVQIGEKTMKLLLDVVSNIDDLVEKANEIYVPNEASAGFLQNLDHQHFELRRNIMCRLCIEPITILEEDFQAHLRKNSHVSRLQRVTQRSLPSAKTHDFNWLVNVNKVWQHGSNNSLAAEIKKESQKENLFMHSLVSDEPVVEHKPKVVGNEQKKKFLNVPLAGNFIGNKWLTVKGRNESESSWDECEIRDFNYDSKYLIEVRGLPWSATKQEVSDFFENVNILNGLNGIHFMVDEKNFKSGRAHIQAEQLKDYVLALKFNNKYMDDRYIEVSTGNVDLFRDMIDKRKIPSKERVVFLEGLPPKFGEQDIRHFFHGLLVSSIKLISNKSCAFVKFRTLDDVESAIKRNDKKSSMRIYRSSEQQMKSAQNSGNTQLATRSSSNNSQSMKSEPKNGSKADDSNHSTKFLKVRGLPWTFNESAIICLFPGLKINRQNGIQMERDKKNRFTGVAFIAFNNPEDYELALSADLTAVNPYIRVNKAAKSQFIAVKEANESQDLKMNSELS